MTLKNKLILVCITLAIVPVILVSATLGYESYQSGRQTIEQQARDQLISIRDIKQQQIEGYFDTIRKQVLTFSNDRMIIDAMSQFKSAFTAYKSTQGATIHRFNATATASVLHRRLSARIWASQQWRVG
ncbi:hypothetical protein [Hahella ganghwensis]|uniref:hypothetical protein n=1 Tax=Hahella ganghwensis TaxID=286420 RepID=UPI00039BC2D2|nr:hypothetical protein [Hahella ganghwensis]